MGGNILTRGKRFIRQLDFPNVDGRQVFYHVIQRRCKKRLTSSSYHTLLTVVSHIKSRENYVTKLSSLIAIALEHDRGRPASISSLPTPRPPCLGGTLTISHPLTNECRHRAPSLYKTAYFICTVFSRHNYVNLHVRSPQG